MIIRLFAVILVILGMSSSYAESPQQLLERDKASCDREADRQYVWIFNTENWRQVYNTCLRRKLQAVNPKYLSTTLQAIRLESECPELMQNAQPVELSQIGYQIVNQMSDRDLRSPAADNNIEHHLLLTYQRLGESQQRIRELRDQKR